MRKRIRRGLKVTYRHRRKVYVVSVALLLLAVFMVINSPALVSASATERRLPIYSVMRDDKVVALSFDAAWGNEDTQILIDILDKYSVKTTFFVVGDWVDRFPESVKELHDAGMEIMNHSDDHAHFSKLNSEEIIRNIDTANDKIEEITGVRPTLFRAPYGEYDDNVVLTVESMGMYTIQWDVDSLDWKELSAEDMTERVLTKVQSGSIVLFHNAAKNTPEALPDIIEGLLAEGYTIVPVSEIIMEGKQGVDYEIDHTGRQFAIG